MSTTATTDKVKGTVKEKTGKAMGDKQMEAEGKTDKAKGKAKDAMNKVKDVADDATK